MELESVYFEYSLKLNREYTKVSRSFRELLSLYENNIRQKFSFFYFSVMERESRVSGRIGSKNEESITKFKIKYSDFMMDYYISNFNSIYDIYFSLTKIIGYRSKLELK
jgi:hypothetical protein